MLIQRALLLVSTLSLVSLLALSAAPAAGQTAEESMELLNVGPLKTKADYLGIANVYTGMAEQARKEAEKHRKMAESYGKGTKVAYRERMKEHCSKIVKLQEDLATEYDKLAEAYRAEAAEK